MERFKYELIHLPSDKTYCLWTGLFFFLKKRANLIFFQKNFQQSSLPSNIPNWTKVMWCNGWNQILNWSDLLLKSNSLQTIFLLSLNKIAQPRILFGRGQSWMSSVTDVTLSPTLLSVYYLTVKNWYKAPVKILAIVSGEPYRGVTRGKQEGTISRALHHCGVPEKSQQCLKYFLQYSIFACKRLQVLTWERQTCFLPRTPSNLLTPLGPWPLRPHFDCATVCSMSVLS